MKIVSTGRERFRESVRSVPIDNKDGSTTHLYEHTRFVQITFANRREEELWDKGLSLEEINGMKL